MKQNNSISRQSQQYQFKQVADAITELAFELYRQFPIQENLIFSPLGIYCILGLLYEGAKGETRNKLSQLLYQDPQLSIASDLKALLDELHTRTQLSEREMWELDNAEARKNKLVEQGEWNEFTALLNGAASAEDVRLVLSIANSIWIQSAYQCKPEFLEIIQSKMVTDVNYLDFAGNPTCSCKVINNWINKKTQGRIGPMLSLDDLSLLSRAILANVIYFKARWENEFQDPKPGLFYLLDGMTTQVQMLVREFWGLNYMKMDNCWVVELPYYQRPVSMVLMLPLDKGVEAFLRLEREFQHYWKNFRVNGTYRWQRITLTMPEFRITANFDITTQLIQLGLHQIFEENLTDFSGISDEKGFHINKILHNTYISVDQYGTEAVAATLAEILGAAEPEEKITITIDHPFLFAIVDKPSGTILFLGKVVNPEGRYYESY